MEGVVTADGGPVLTLTIAGQTWQALVDTGFNGDVELPLTLQPVLNARYRGHVHSLLAAGQSILETEYTVDFPFDGETREAGATFVTGQMILIGTGLLRRYRLTIDFPGETVLLEKVGS